jgi:hypothetical protein
MKNLLAAVAWALASLSQAAPHVPSDDRAVLERLPGRPGDPARAELRALRSALASAPMDAALAARVALKLFERANAEGDPRYVGYAEAALAPWRAGDAPADVIYARALVRQYRHDFDGALKDLRGVLAKAPAHEGARAWRAAILMVRAEYDLARRECAALPPDTLHALACMAYVEATTGRTRSAYARLLEGIDSHDASPSERLWAMTRLAEMAWRLDDRTAAEKHFRDALGLGIEDNFVLAAYADFLLENGRAQEVLSALRGRGSSDTLLLRLAIAQKTAGAPEAQASIRTLGERFAAAALRGEKLHLAEEARYLLELKGDARAALAAALENWKDQREPRDALMVLEAAAAARDPQAAAPVLQWLKDTGFESARLARLAASLR